MILTKLTVAVNGALWQVYGFEIEGVDVIDKWKDTEDGGEVRLKRFPLSDDGILDIYIYIAAPNGTPLEIAVSGTLEDNAKDFQFSAEAKVIRNGKLRITITEKISDHYIIPSN